MNQEPFRGPDGPREGAADVTGELLALRTVVLRSPLDHQVVDEVTARLLALANEDPTREARLIVSGSGGSVVSALALCDVLQSLPMSVATMGLGEIGLAGTLVLAAGTPGLRRVMPHARLYTRFSDAAEGSGLSDVSRLVMETNVQRSAVLTQLTGFTRLGTGDLELLLRSTQPVIPSDAVAWGFVDAIARS